MEQITNHNYDHILKEAFSLFHNKSLDFLGVDLPAIVSFMETEFAETETYDDLLDLTFLLADGSILHLEEETHLSLADLIRFAHYDLRLYNRYKTPIHTLVLTPAQGTSGITRIDTGSCQYTVEQLVLKDRDGDAVAEQIGQALARGEQINELELIFLPLMKSRLDTVSLLRKTIELEKQVPDTVTQEKIRELTLIVANRIVDKNILDELWEELRMLKVIRYAEEKGMEKGMKEGREKGREEGREEGKKKGQVMVIKKQLIKKFGNIPSDLLDAITNLKDEKLEVLSIELIDMTSLDDLRRFVA